MSSHFQVRIEGRPRVGVRAGSFRTRHTVVDEPSNGEQLRELSNSTVVVMMKVGDEQVIDLLDTRVVRRRQYSIRIPCQTRLNRRIVVVGTVACPSGVVEQRVPVGSDD